MASALIDFLDIDNLRYDLRQGIKIVNSVFCLAVYVWCGQCVMRACVLRTGQGRSVFLSGLVFLFALCGLLQALASLGGNASVMAQNWYREKTNGWHPLTVIADPVLGRIVANGDITLDSDRLFERVVRDNPALTVVQLESYGGYVDEAMRMALLIRARGLDTVSMRRCASACTLMFVAGHNRYLGPDARFQFHRAGYEGMPKTRRLEVLDQELARFYLAMGAGPEIAQGELAAPHHSFWEPSQGEMFAANYATLRWSERPAGM